MQLLNHPSLGQKSELNEMMMHVQLIKNYQFKSKTTMLKLSLCNCSNAFLFATGTIKFAEETQVARQNKKVLFENCPRFTDCVSKTREIG